MSLRAVLVGLCGVVFICGLTYYNDYAVASTFLVGNFLPIGLLLFFLVLLLGVNAPLHRWAPRQALSSGELAVALGMVLVACTIPSSGLMRYLPGSIVGMHHQAASNEEYRRLLANLDLPDWMLPTFERTDPARRGAEDVIQHFWFRAPAESDTFAARWREVPWRAWVRPMLTWGALLVFVYGAVICLCVIVRRQWVENERLPFPLAGVYLSLVEAPPPGKAFNALFRSRSFWLAAGMVFSVHALRMLHVYFPRLAPDFRISFNLSPVVADTILRYTDWFSFQQQTLYFSVIGITFFIQTKVAFSLWAFFLMFQGAKVATGVYQADLKPAMLFDQSLGALLVFGLMIAWVGRHHWAMIARHMVGCGGTTSGERYLPYAVAGWGLLLCLAGVVAWLMLAGVTLAGAIVLVLLLMLMFVSVARVVAETGLTFVQFPPGLTRPWIHAIPVMSDGLRLANARSFFFTAWFQLLFTHDLRESLSVYGTHSLRVADQAAYAHFRRRSALRFLGALALALTVGYGVSWISTLYVEYSHAVTMSAYPYGPINTYGVESAPREMLRATVEALPPRAGPPESHSRMGHLGFGAGLAALLAYLRARFTAWPLHPVGFLLAYSYPLSMIWFSVFIGWLTKVLIVRFGGAGLLRAAGVFFIGLVVGEAGASAFWLIVSLVLNLAGLPYHAVRLLPA